MPTPIETREYHEPSWQEFDWVINGQRIRGVFTVIEKVGKLMTIRLSLNIGQRPENVTIDIKRRSRRERDENGRPKDERDSEEYYTISYWSPGLTVGKLITIPRELVEIQKDGPLFVQIEELSVHGIDIHNNPTYPNLG